MTECKNYIWHIKRILCVLLKCCMFLFIILNLFMYNCHWLVFYTLSVRQNTYMYGLLNNIMDYQWLLINADTSIYYYVLHLTDPNRNRITRVNTRRFELSKIKWKRYVPEISSFINRRKEFFWHQRNGSEINEMVFYTSFTCFFFFFCLFTLLTFLFPFPLRGHWNLDGFVVLVWKKNSRKAIGRRF